MSFNGVLGSGDTIGLEIEHDLLGVVATLARDVLAPLVRESFPTPVSPPQPLVFDTANRKGGSSIWSRAPTQGQSPGEVVEGDSEVLEAVTGQHGEGAREGFGKAQVWEEQVPFRNQR